MNSTEYSVDRRDIRFVQKELLQIQSLTAYAPFTEFTEEDFDMILEEGSKFVESVFAPLNKAGDEQTMPAMIAVSGIRPLARAVRNTRAGLRRLPRRPIR